MMPHPLISRRRAAAVTLAVITLAALMGGLARPSAARADEAAAEAPANELPPLRISGQVSAAFGYLHEPGTSAFGDRPAQFSTASEGRLNFSFGSETFSGFIGIWRKYQDDVPQTPTKDHFQITWRPVASFRLDVGRLAYVPWNVRAVDFHNYTGWSPVVNGFDYIGYTENTDGADFNYVIDQGTEAGFAIFTGNTRIFLDPNFRTNAHQGETGAVPAADGEGGVTTTEPSVVSSTVYAPHVMVTAGPTEWRAAYFQEDVETGADWDHAKSFTNVAYFFSFKWFFGDSGARVDIDYTAADYEQNDTTVSSPAVSVTVPAGWNNLLWVEYNPAVFSPDEGSDTEINFYAIGYTIPVARGSVIQPRYKRQDTDGTVDSTLAVVEVGFLQQF